MLHAFALKAKNLKIVLEIFFFNTVFILSTIFFCKICVLTNLQKSWKKDLWQSLLFRKVAIAKNEQCA